MLLLNCYWLNKVTTNQTIFFFFFEENSIGNVFIFKILRVDDFKEKLEGLSKEVDQFRKKEVMIIEINQFTKITLKKKCWFILAK